MADAMAIAASGMRAASLAMRSFASNIVNANTSGPPPSPSPSNAAVASAGGVYQPTIAVQTPVAGGGVTSSLQASLPAYSLTYAPQASYANGQGMVAQPNVDVPAQFVGQMEAANSFRANLAVFQSSSRMYKALLDITA